MLWRVKQRVPIPVVIVLSVAAIVIPWWQGSRDMDFMTQPDDAVLAHVRAKTSLAHREKSRLFTVKPEPKDTAAIESPIRAAPAIDPGDPNTPAALNAYADHASEGAAAFATLAVHLEEQKANARALLAWERVLDVCPDTASQRQAALAGIERLRPKVAPWNIDPVAAKPLVLAARQNPAQSKPESAKPGNEGLSYCNQMEAKPLGLRSPGGKNLVQFDKCYRGRLHNVCLAKALSVMTSSLQQDYEKLVETNYPAIASTSAVCAFAFSKLADDFETAKAFNARYKALVDGYDERLKCTDLVFKALEKATFPDLPNIEKTVKTMADELKTDVAQFAKERQSAASIHYSPTACLDDAGGCRLGRYSLARGGLGLESGFADMAVLLRPAGRRHLQRDPGDAAANGGLTWRKFASDSRFCRVSVAGDYDSLCRLYGAWFHGAWRDRTRDELDYDRPGPVPLGRAASAAGGAAAGRRGVAAIGKRRSLHHKLRHHRIVVADVSFGFRNCPEDVHVVLILLLAANHEVAADGDRVEFDPLFQRFFGHHRRRDQNVIELLVNEVRLFRLTLVELEQVDEIVVGRRSVQAAERAQIAGRRRRFIRLFGIYIPQHDEITAATHAFIDPMAG